MNEITFYAERDEYGRSTHVAEVDGHRVGVIVRLPKRTFPIPTYLVNDFRVTRPIREAGGRYEDGIKYVSSLKEAKALFA